jgi:hypothetical protein
MLGQALQHRGDGRRRDVKELGKGSSGRRYPVAAQFPDGLERILGRVGPGQAATVEPGPRDFFTLHGHFDAKENLHWIEPAYAARPAAVVRQCTSLSKLRAADRPRASGSHQAQERLRASVSVCSVEPEDQVR